MHKERLRKIVLIMLLALVVVSFIAGIFVGSIISNPESKKIEKMFKENELDTKSFVIEQQLITTFEKANCDILKNRISALSNKLGNIGRQLNNPNLEKEIGSENIRYLKIEYHLLQINTYTLFKKLENSCGEKYNIILFYYGADNESIEQGYILDKIVADKDAKVFAIQHNYAEQIAFMERYYQINKTPTLIINFRTRLEGLTDYESIEKALSR